MLDEPCRLVSRWRTSYSARLFQRSADLDPIHQLNDILSQQEGQQVQGEMEAFLQELRLGNKDTSCPAPDHRLTTISK